MKNSLWVEKYRPTTVSEYVFVDDRQREQVKQWIAAKSFPHLLLSGDPGTGKTTLLGTFPKVLHLDIREEGEKVLKKIKGIKSARIEDWDELVSMYWYLKKNKQERFNYLI